MGYTLKVYDPDNVVHIRQISNRRADLFAETPLVVFSRPDPDGVNPDELPQPFIRGCLREMREMREEGITPPPVGAYFRQRARELQRRYAEQPGPWRFHGPAQTIEEAATLADRLHWGTEDEFGRKTWIAPAEMIFQPPKPGALPRNRGALAELAMARRVEASIPETPAIDRFLRSLEEE